MTCGGWLAWPGLAWSGGVGLAQCQAVAAGRSVVVTLGLDLRRAGLGIPAREALQFDRQRAVGVGIGNRRPTLFLAADDSDGMTGQHVLVDGGIAQQSVIS